MESRHDAMDSDGSFMEWKQSSRYNCWNRTPQGPSVAQKRKNPDELDVSNRTFSVKRRRIDGQNEIEIESEMDENVEEQKVDDSTNPQIERVDEIAEAVETTKEAEINGEECLVSTQTADVKFNATPGNVPLLHLMFLLHVNIFVFSSVKRRSSRRLARSPPLDDAQADDADGNQQSKSDSLQSTIKEVETNLTAQTDTVDIDITPSKVQHA